MSRDSTSNKALLSLMIVTTILLVVVGVHMWVSSDPELWLFGPMAIVMVFLTSWFVAWIKRGTQ